MSYSDYDLIRLIQEDRNRAIEEEQREQAMKESESNIADATNYNSFVRTMTRNNAGDAYSKFKRDTTKHLLESVFGKIVDKTYMAAIEESQSVFHKELFSNLIDDYGVDEFMNVLEDKSIFTASINVAVKEAVSAIMENVDPADPSTFAIDPSVEGELLDSIDGDETIDDITNAIHAKVATATEDFLLRNSTDANNINDILASTQEKIAGIRTGDDETDKEVANEYTLMAKRKINEIRNRPHKVLEQIVLNIAEAAIVNEDLKPVYVKEGKIDMDLVVDKAKSIYSFLEFLDTTRFIENADQVKKLIQIV